MAILCTVEMEVRKKKEVVGARSAASQNDDGATGLRDGDDLGNADPR
jgi:hypothetical protein